MQPDLVAICTAACLPKGSDPPASADRPDSHVDLTVQVAKLGVPLIHCEKAMASSLAGADKVLAALTAGDVEAAHAVTEACLAVAVSHARGGSWVDLPLVGADREMYVYHV